jgi:hypothetical protein
MQTAWGLSWVWGLCLIALTLAMHAFGIAVLVRAVERITFNPGTPGRLDRHPMTLTACALGLVGWVLAVLHGIEAGIWAAAYLWLGAIGSARDAMLYSVDSITTRGASGLVLEQEWRMLGALEAADGMLLFGISTAFAFAIIVRIDHIILKKMQGHRP